MSYRKDPVDRMDYGFDWAAPDENGNTWLVDGDSISTSSWEIEPSSGTLTKFKDEHSPTVTAIWVDGGTVGETYRLVNTVVTTQGRKKQKVHTIRVVDE